MSIHPKDVTVRVYIIHVHCIIVCWDRVCVCVCVCLASSSNITITSTTNLVVSFPSANVLVLFVLIESALVGCRGHGCVLH